MSDVSQLISPDLLAEMGIDAEEFAFFGTNAGEFAPTARTTTFKRDEKVTFRAFTQAPTYGDTREQDESGRFAWQETDPGKQVTAYGTLSTSTLTRLTLIRQSSPDQGTEYLLVTGVMRNAMDMGVILDNREVRMDELLNGFVNATISDENKKQPLEAWVQQAKGIGLDINGTMPMLFQHFGANPEAVEEMFAKFEEFGAIDGMGPIQNPGRIERILYIPAGRDGVPITSFDVSGQNRAYSRTKQGFLDFPNAQIESFGRVVRYRKAYHAALAALAEDIKANKRGLTDAKIKERKADADLLLERSREFVANWSGVQQRMNVDLADVNKPILTPAEPLKFDPVNCGVGRFSWALDGENPTEVDLWTNSARAGTPPPSNETTSTTNQSGVAADVLKAADEEAVKADQNAW